MPDEREDWRYILCPLPVLRCRYGETDADTVIELARRNQRPGQHPDRIPISMSRKVLGCPIVLDIAVVVPAHTRDAYFEEHRC